MFKMHMKTPAIKSVNTIVIENEWSKICIEPRHINKYIHEKYFNFIRYERWFLLHYIKLVLSYRLLFFKRKFKKSLIKLEV